MSAQPEAPHPAGIVTLDDYRAWARSDAFPQTGRISYINGQIEVDMSPENIFLHASAKKELSLVIGMRVKTLTLGEAFMDGTLISIPEADVSNEPDLSVVSDDAIATGRVTPIPTKDGRPDSYIELEGPPDLVVEIVSPSSVQKDKVRLFECYEAGGVREYWIIDARGAEIEFFLSHHDGERYVAVEPDADEYRFSEVLDAGYLLTRHRDPNDYWAYDLLETTAKR